MSKKLIIVASCLAGAMILVAAPKDKTVKTKATLSKERIQYAVEYDDLKSGLLGKVCDEMGEVETLQAIAVLYSRAFKKTEERLNKLERSTALLQDDMDKMRQWAHSVDSQIGNHEQRIKKLEDQVKAHDTDLGNLFNWSNAVDDELHNNLKIGGIRADVESLRQSVKRAETKIDNLDYDVRRNAAAINDLAGAIRSLR